MKKFTDVLSRVFAIGVLICLFAGGLSLAAYVAAILIGGELATAICAFIFRTYLPWVIRFTSLFTGVGLLALYFSKVKALTVANEDIHRVKNDEKR